MCCGYRTLEQLSAATYDICPVCFWEDDRYEEGDLDEVSPCNRVSLRQARANFRRYGACTADMIPHVRKPARDELPLH